MIDMKLFRQSEATTAIPHTRDFAYFAVDHELICQTKPLFLLLFHLLSAIGYRANCMQCGTSANSTRNRRHTTRRQSMQASINERF